MWKYKWIEITVSAGFNLGSIFTILMRKKREKTLFAVTEIIFTKLQPAKNVKTRFGSCVSNGLTKILQVIKENPEWKTFLKLL